MSLFNLTLNTITHYLLTLRHHLQESTRYIKEMNYFVKFLGHQLQIVNPAIFPEEFFKNIYEIMDIDPVLNYKVFFFN